MAVQARVWICTEDLTLLRADQIVGLSIRAPRGRTHVPNAVSEPERSAPAQIVARTPGSTGDEPAGDISVLSCPGDAAVRMVAELARVLTEATDYPEPCAFVYAVRAANSSSWTWTIAGDLPERWPGPATTE